MLDPDVQEAWARRVYDALVTNPAVVPAMVAALADTRRLEGTTGFSPAEVALVLRHVVVDRHLLTDPDTGLPTRRARFDPDADMAEAFVRVFRGTQTPADVTLMEHELAEARHLAAHPGTSYRAAHAVATARADWWATGPQRTGESIEGLEVTDGGVPGVREGAGDGGRGGVPLRPGREPADDVGGGRPAGPDGLAERGGRGPDDADGGARDREAPAGDGQLAGPGRDRALSPGRLSPAAVLRLARELQERAWTALPQAEQDEVTAQVAAAERVADQVTALLQGVLTTVGPELGLAGLAHRVKAPASIARAIQPLRRLRALSATDAVATLNDRLRFTVVVPVDGYTATVQRVLAGLQEQGLTVRAKSFWRPGNRYLGLNVVVRGGPDDVPFEVQFPTPDTHDVGHDTHPDYELHRLPVELAGPLAQVPALGRILDANALSELDERIPAGVEDFGTPKDTGPATALAADAELVDAYLNALAERGTSVVEHLLEQEVTRPTARLLADIIEGERSATGRGTGLPGGPGPRDGGGVERLRGPPGAVDDAARGGLPAGPGPVGGGPGGGAGARAEGPGPGGRGDHPGRPRESGGRGPGDGAGAAQRGGAQADPRAGLSDPPVAEVGTAQLPVLAGVLPVELAAGPVPLLFRLVLPPDGRPPVVVLTELAGSPAPWADPRLVASAADELTARSTALQRTPPDRVLWFAEHLPHDGADGLLRRLEVRREDGRHSADPRRSEAMTSEAAAWWRGVLELRPAPEVLERLTGGDAQRWASATASERSR